MDSRCRWWPETLARFEIDEQWHAGVGGGRILRTVRRPSRDLYTVFSLDDRWQNSVDGKALDLAPGKHRIRAAIEILTNADAERVDPDHRLG